MTPAPKQPFFAYINDTVSHESQVRAGDAAHAQNPAALKPSDRRDPAKVDLVINSHLHFDHVGGNEFVPNATVVVQKREWQIGQSDEGESKFGFYKADFDHGHPVREVEGEHDLFGDGSVLILSTPGHTLGHQSMKVKTANSGTIKGTAGTLIGHGITTTTGAISVTSNTGEIRGLSTTAAASG